MPLKSISKNLDIPFEHGGHLYVPSSFFNVAHVKHKKKGVNQ